MRLAIDAMGTDKGPMTIIKGVKKFLEQDGADSTVIVVGDEVQLNKGLKEFGLSGNGRVEVVHASQVVEMDDKIGALREKKDSSIAKTVSLIKEGKADGFVALGNTMAAVASARLGLGHLKGIHRAGIAVPMPSKCGACVTIDMGANINVKPKHLYTYGVMASAYSELVLGVENPKVGLLNVGEEEVKGNDVVKEAFGLLKDAPINFIGNVEGGDIFTGTCDVVVCDGFVGNVVLKASEGVARQFSGILKSEIKKNFFRKLGAWLSKGAFEGLKKHSNYDQYGGAPLLGVDGVCIIGHGRSNSRAVMNALRVAGESISKGLNKHISDTIGSVAEELREVAVK
jgi:glycerol-3-phosphate acyltransferase PlsX